MKKFFTELWMFIKWFFREINILKWTFENRPMANPFQIIRRLTFMIPIKIAKWIYIILIAAGWGISDAQQTKQWMD